MRYIKYKHFSFIATAAFIMPLGLALVVSLAAASVLPARVLAVKQCQPGYTLVDGTTCAPDASHGTGGLPSSGNASSSTPDPAVSSGNCSALNKCDLIVRYINPFITFLAALVGVAVAISIIIGGIQYGSSAGDPQKASAAKNRIRNALIALVTFLFLYALLNFLVPGGIFNK